MPACIAASASTACSRLLPERMTTGRSVDRRRSSSACAMRRALSSAARYVSSRHAPAASRTARNVRSGARSAQRTSRSVNLSGYVPSGWGDRARSRPRSSRSTIVSGARMRADRTGPSRCRVTSGEPGAVQLAERAPVGGKLREQRRRTPALAVITMEPRHLLEDIRQPEPVGVEHRAAAPGREAVAVDVDHVDVRRPCGDAGRKRARAFVDQRQHGALHNLVSVIARG